MKSVRCLMVSVALAFAGSTLAQDEEKAPAFKDVDTNGDGYISVAEAQESEAVAGMFAELDSNADGQLSAEEYGKAAEVE